MIGGYDMDAPRFSYGALTMVGDGWPNGSCSHPTPCDEPTAAWTPRCEEDEHYAKEDD